MSESEDSTNARDEGDIAAAAEDLVTQAQALVGDQDHVWDLIADLSIPLELVEDRRQQSKVRFDTEQMVRLFLCQHVYGWNQNAFNVDADKYPAFRTFGFDTEPRQQTISQTWHRFSPDTRQMIRAAAGGIRQIVVEEDIVAASTVPSIADDDPSHPDKYNDGDPEYVRRKTTKTVRLGRRYINETFDTYRAENKQYSDEDIFDMFSRMASNNGSAHSEGEFNWITDYEIGPADSTFLRALKTISEDANDQQLDLTTAAAEQRGVMERIEQIRDEVLTPFDMCVERLVNTIREDEPFSNRHTVAAIDITTIRFYPSPYDEDNEPKEDFPPMVSGTKNSDERAYKYATLSIVGESVPIILAIEPVKENSTWEPEGAVSYPKDEIVGRLLDRAQQFDDIDEVLMDRGFYSKAVMNEVNKRDIIYTMPVPAYKKDKANLEDVREEVLATAGVLHNYKDDDLSHTPEYMYIVEERPPDGVVSDPIDNADWAADDGLSDETDKDDKEEADESAMILVTNRDWVEPEEIAHIRNRYTRRWDIENTYKSVKRFLPRTSSKDYRVRFAGFVLAAVIYNVWRLVDYLIKSAMDIPLREDPVVTAKTVARALGDYLPGIT